VAEVDLLKILNIAEHRAEKIVTTELPLVAFRWPRRAISRLTDERAV